MAEFDVIVVGGGPAGVTAALRARELGASVALVERHRLGGTCTNDGCVPTRVLAHAARLIRDAAQFSHYGLAAEPPSLDFAGLLARTQQVVYQIHEKKQLLAHLEEAGVRVFAETGTARFVSEHSLALGDGTRLQGRAFILCAGGRARRIPFPGSELALTHSDIWSLGQLPASIAFLGGAATGSQLASIFRAFGARVWVLETGLRLLGREDPLVSAGVQSAFDRQGIRVVTGISLVERLERLDNGLRLWYQHQDSLHAITVEAVVMASGWPGNADSLNLAAAGVQSERGYVVVDDHLRTTAPHIFAAGDITGRVMLVQSAGFEARSAAENAVLGAGQRNQHLIVPHGGFTDPEYAGVGLTEEQARKAEPDCLVVEVAYQDLDRAVIDGYPEGACKLIVSRQTHRILGAHIVGEQALEIIQVVAAGMTAELWVEQLAEMELAYPTYTAILGLAARQAVRKLGVMPLATQWHALGRAHIAEWERSAG